jgi:hypothetical protein
MNGHCRYERDVMIAASENSWTDPLRRHISACEECASAATVAPWMSQLAATDVRDRALPPASAVWLKAQLLGSQAAGERASRPFTIFQWVAYAVVASGWSGLITWKWSAVQQWLFSLSPASLIQKASGVATPSIPISFYIGIVVLTSVTMILALHTILAEE